MKFISKMKLGSFRNSRRKKLLFFSRYEMQTRFSSSFLVLQKGKCIFPEEFSNKLATDGVHIVVGWFSCWLCALNWEAKWSKTIIIWPCKIHLGFSSFCWHGNSKKANYPYGKLLPLCSKGLGASRHLTFRQIDPFCQRNFTHKSVPTGQISYSRPWAYRHYRKKMGCCWVDNIRPLFCSLALATAPF